jgi:uncharacterized protein YggE
MRQHLRTVVGVCAAWLALGAAQGAQAAELRNRGGQDEVPKLTVRGGAELQKPADQLRLQVAVVTEDAAATTALAENSRRMEAVIKALGKVGLTKQEYETGRFSVRPVYASRPRNAGPEWQRKIVGYEVTNSLSVKTGKLDLAGRLIQAANEAGANSIDVRFDLASPRTHRNEAITTATAHARADAEVLARAADVRLVRVLTIHLDQAGWQPPVPTMARTTAMAEASVAPPIRPGDVTVRAAVTLVYEIE